MPDAMPLLVTHSGSFHCDEAFAYVVLRLALGLGQAGEDHRLARTRDAALIAQVKSDPHSPSEFRVNGSLRNHPGYYEAFDVKPGDRMYLAPEQRVIFW